MWGVTERVAPYLHVNKEGTRFLTLFTGGVSI